MSLVVLPRPWSARCARGAFRGRGDEAALAAPGATIGPSAGLVAFRPAMFRPSKPPGRSPLPRRARRPSRGRSACAGAAPARATHRERRPHAPGDGYSLGSMRRFGTRHRRPIARRRRKARATQQATRASPSARWRDGRVTCPRELPRPAGRRRRRGPPLHVTLVASLPRSQTSGEGLVVRDSYEMEPLNVSQEFGSPLV